MGPPSYKLVYKPWTHWLYLVISTLNPIEFSHLFSSATERNNERTGGSGDAPLRSCQVGGPPPAPSSLGTPGAQTREAEKRNEEFDD